MPTLTKRTYLIKNKDGVITRLTENDEILEQVEAEVTCTGPHCGKSNPDGLPTKVAWNSDQVRDDPDGLPDQFYRLITLIPSPTEKQQLVFCCAGCVKDYLTYVYVKPQSPREIALAALNNQKADEKKGKVVPFSGPVGDLPVLPDPEFERLKKKALDELKANSHMTEPLEGENDRS
jgi:hypothetical protein